MDPQPEASSSAAARAPEATEEKKSIGARIINRAKTVLRKKDGSKRFSVFSKAPSAGDEGRKDDAGPSDEPPPPEAARTEWEDVEGVERVPKLQLFEERARTLGQRFGLEITVGEWQTATGTAFRMEKPIRMRVRRNCHQCNATFGQDRACPGCGHPRCGKCIRSPPRKTEEERAATRARVAEKMKLQKEAAANYIVPDWDAHRKKLPPITRPSRTGGQDLVRKKPRQRIRRHCHECGTLFVSGSKQCGSCNHSRCTDCPRDPAKRDKYPYGYPGDEFGPNSIPYHQCHACYKVYPGNAPDGTSCAGCGHQKCRSCQRMKPQKVEPAPDEELLKSIQLKLDSLCLDP